MRPVRTIRTVTDLKFNWWVLSAAGTFDQTVEISANNGASVATINVPPDSAGKTFHVICEVTDDGTPNLSGYRRIIFATDGMSDHSSHTAQDPRATDRNRRPP